MADEITNYRISFDEASQINIITGQVNEKPVIFHVTSRSTTGVVETKEGQTLKLGTYAPAPAGVA